MLLRSPVASLLLLAGVLLPGPAAAAPRLYFVNVGCLVLSTGLLGDDPRCVVGVEWLPDAPETSPIALDPFRRELFIGPVTRGPRSELVGALSSYLLAESAHPFPTGTFAPGLYAADSYAPRGIALDLAAGKVYWTQIVDEGGCCFAPYGELVRANLDLTGIETLATGFGTVRGVAVDRAAGKVYWSADGAIRRANLDGSDSEVFHDPPAGGVGHLVLDAIGERLYWMNEDPGQADAILGIDLDGSDPAVEQDGLSNAGGLAFDADARALYWSENLPGPVDAVRRKQPGGSEVETLAPRYLSAFVVAEAPAAPGYEIAIADDGRAVVDLVDPRTWTREALTVAADQDRLQAPRGVAVDANGDLLVADLLAQEIARIDPDTRAQTAASAPGVLDGPADVVLDGEGRIVVADLGAGLVRRLAPDGASALDLAFLPSADGPLGLAVDGAGALFASDGPSASILQVDEATSTPVSTGAPLARPLRLAAGPPGTLYASDTALDSVLAIDVATGDATPILPGDSFQDPFGVAVEPRNGDLLVLDRVAGQLFRVDPARGYRRPLTHPGAFADPRGIAILPVPEPGAGGSVIASVALAVARRTRRRPPRRE